MRCDAGAGMDVGRDSEGGGSDVGRGRDAGRSRGGSALGTARSAAVVHARLLAAAERASGFVRLPDCSPVPYGLPLPARLRLGSPMCWAVRALSTLPRQRFFPLFAPICAAVSGQEC